MYYEEWESEQYETDYWAETYEDSPREERIPTKKDFGKDGVSGKDIRSRRSRRRSFSTNSYKQSRRNAERAKDEA